MSWVTITALILFLFPVITFWGWLFDKMYRKETLFSKTTVHPAYWLDKLLSRLPGCFATCCRTCRVDEEASIEKETRPKCLLACRKTNLKAFPKCEDRVCPEKNCENQKGKRIKVDKTKHDENGREQFSSSESSKYDCKTGKDSYTPSSTESTTDHKISNYPNDQLSSPDTQQSECKIDKDQYNQLTSSESTQNVCEGSKDRRDQFLSSDSVIQKLKKDEEARGCHEALKQNFTNGNKRIRLKISSTDSDTFIQKKDSDTQDTDIFGFHKDLKKNLTNEDKHIPIKISSSDSDKYIQLDIHKKDSDTQVHKKDKDTCGYHKDLKQNLTNEDKRIRIKISSSDSDKYTQKTNINKKDSDTQVQKIDKDTCGNHEDLKQSLFNEYPNTYDQISSSCSDTFSHKKDAYPKKLSSDSETIIENKNTGTCHDNLKRRDNDKHSGSLKDHKDQRKDAISVCKKYCSSCKKVYEKYHVPKDASAMHQPETRRHTSPQRKKRHCSPDVHKKRQMRKRCYGIVPKVLEKRREILTDTDRSPESSQFTINSKNSTIKKYRSMGSNTTSESTADSECPKSPTIKSCLKKPKRERSKDLSSRKISLNKSQKHRKCKLIESLISLQELRKDKSDTKKPISKKKQQSPMTNLRISTTKQPTSKKKRRCSMTSFRKSLKRKRTSKPKQRSSMTSLRNPMEKKRSSTKKPILKRQQPSMTILRKKSQGSLCSCKSTSSQLSIKSLSSPSCYHKCARTRQKWEDKPPHRVNPSCLPKTRLPQSFKVTKFGDVSERKPKPSRLPQYFKGAKFGDVSKRKPKPSRLPQYFKGAKFGKVFESKPKPQTKHEESFLSVISSTISDSLSDVNELQNRCYKKLKSLQQKKTHKEQAQEWWHKVTKKKNDPFCDFVHKFLK